MGDRERRVRDEAYRIWNEAGRPEGRESEHWYEAEKRVPKDEDDAAKPAKRAKSVKPIVSSAANGGVATEVANDAPRRAPEKGAAVDVAPSRAKSGKSKGDDQAKSGASKRKP